MKIAVVGQGYVGLTAAACLAEAGHEVVGVERTPERLHPLEDGRVPFFEPGLQELVGRTREDARLRFAGSIEDLAGGVEAIMVAVGSPQLPSGGADLRDLLAAIEEILALDPLPELIVVKSTVPPGTSRELIAREGPRLAERYAYSPEFLSQGSALAGWRRPARVVAGLEDERLLPRLRDLFQGVEAPWITTTPTNAEMIKYASNAFLATKISFINEIANLTDEVGGTIDEVVEGLALDPRVGSHFLRAGIGYGGSCFPKDVQALTHLSSLRGKAMPLLQSVVAVNNAQRLRVVRTVRESLGPRSGVPVAVLGLAFKPDTDDTREAPSLTVVPELVAAGYSVRVWDPVVRDEVAGALFPGTERAKTVEEAADGAGVAVILTEWPQVRDADWGAVADSMTEPKLVVDARNCLDPGALGALGLSYTGIGRGHRPAVDRTSPTPEKGR